jgi:hypothetical protein
LLGLFLLAITMPASAQSSVTLAWDASIGGGMAGYYLYMGGASGSYTNRVDAGSATTQTVSGLWSGTYFFSATAYDTNGLESDFSNEVSYTIPWPTNAPVTVALTSPGNGATFKAPASISLAAAVVANGHTITKVRFYSGSTLLAEDPVTPYNFTWNNVNVGTYDLRAQAVYDSGRTIDSATATVTVKKTPRLGIQSTTAVANAHVVPMNPSSIVVLSAADGDPGQILSVQSSVDLSNWTEIGNITLDAEGCSQFTYSVSTKMPLNFYRLQAN